MSFLMKRSCLSPAGVSLKVGSFVADAADSASLSVSGLLEVAAAEALFDVTGASVPDLVAVVGLRPFWSAPPCGTPSMPSASEEKKPKNSVHVWAGAQEVPGEGGRSTRPPSHERSGRSSKGET